MGEVIGLFPPIRGIRIIEDPNLVQDGKPRVVRRSLRERLFSRPWRPLQRTRTVIPKEPRIEALEIRPGVLVMHPATARALREVLRRKGGS